MYCRSTAMRTSKKLSKQCGFTGQICTEEGLSANNIIAAVFGNVSHYISHRLSQEERMINGKYYTYWTNSTIAFGQRESVC